MTLGVLLIGVGVLFIAFLPAARRIIATFVDVVDASVALYALRTALRLDTATARQRRIDRRRATEQAELARRIGVSDPPTSDSRSNQPPPARAPTRLVAAGEPEPPRSNGRMLLDRRHGIVMAAAMTTTVLLVGFASFQWARGGGHEAGGVLGAIATPGPHVTRASARPAPQISAGPAGVGASPDPSVTPSAAASPAASEAAGNPIPLVPQLTDLTRRITTGAAGRGTVPVRLGWKVVSEDSSVDRFQITVSVDGGTSRTVDRPAAGDRSARVNVPIGRSIVYTLVATDVNGKAVATADWAPIRISLTQDSSSRIRTAGPWRAATGPSLSGGHVRFSSLTGAWMRLGFRGSDVAWLATQTPFSGRAQVRVDGRIVAKVDLDRSSVNYRRTVFRWHGASVQRHTIEVRVIGGGRVDVDAFIILR